MRLSRRGFLGLAPAAVLTCGCPAARQRVVLYCAQDQEFAEGVLGSFTEQTGLPVTPKFDTEANKSVSLYREIVAEKDRPRCDVFWNNEILNTVRLAEKGLLLPYASPAAEPYPAWAKAADHAWHAFAERARVLVVNTRLVKENEFPQSLLELTDPRWRGRVVMGKPNHSTSATQAACLFEVLGAEKAKEYYRGLVKNGMQLAPGNKQVAEWVGQGRTPRGEAVSVGVTDTDDALDEVKAGRAAALVFADQKASAEARMGTLFIPNTLAILRGGPNPEGAKQLVDYLLSAEVERRLAEGPGAQIPVNPKVKAALPAQIRTRATIRAMRVDWQKAAAGMDEVQRFLAKEILAS